MRMSSVKKITISSVCIALCCVLPTLFHSIGLGTAFSPIHIPVLLCGLVCGSGYGAACGIIGPLLSSMITGMPGPAMLPSMVPELFTYGLVSGLMMKVIHTGKLSADLYTALGVAMILGRVVGGIAKALFFMGSGEAFTLAIWASSYFVATLPGIVCHLIVIPLLVMMLAKAKMIPNRYPKGASCETERCN